MFRAFFEGSELLGYPLAGLVFFIAVFVLATAAALRKQRGQVDALARLPLADDTAPLHAPADGDRDDV